MEDNDKKEAIKTFLTSTKMDSVSFSIDAPDSKTYYMVLGKKPIEEVNKIKRDSYFNDYKYAYAIVYDEEMNEIINTERVTQEILDAKEKYIYRQNEFDTIYLDSHLGRGKNPKKIFFDNKLKVDPDYESVEIKYLIDLEKKYVVINKTTEDIPIASFLFRGEQKNIIDVLHEENLLYLCGMLGIHAEKHDNGFTYFDVADMMKNFFEKWRLFHTKTFLSKTASNDYFLIPFDKKLVNNLNDPIENPYYSKPEDDLLDEVVSLTTREVLLKSNFLDTDTIDNDDKAFLYVFNNKNELHSIIVGNKIRDEDNIYRMIPYYRVLVGENDKLSIEPFKDTNGYEINYMGINVSGRYLLMLKQVSNKNRKIRIYDAFEDKFIYEEKDFLTKDLLRSRSPYSMQVPAIITNSGMIVLDSPSRVRLIYKFTGDNKVEKVFPYSTSKKEMIEELKEQYNQGNMTTKEFNERLGKIERTTEYWVYFDINGDKEKIDTLVTDMNKGFIMPNENNIKIIERTGFKFMVQEFRDYNKINSLILLTYKEGKEKMYIKSEIGFRKSLPGISKDRVDTYRFFYSITDDNKYIWLASVKRINGTKYISISVYDIETDKTHDINVVIDSVKYTARYNIGSSRKYLNIDKDNFAIRNLSQSYVNDPLNVDIDYSSEISYIVGKTMDEMKKNQLKRLDMEEKRQNKKVKEDLEI